MARLPIVHHPPSPTLHTLFEAVREGANDPAIEGVEVVVRPALAATAIDVLQPSSSSPATHHHTSHNAKRPLSDAVTQRITALRGILLTRREILERCHGGREPASHVSAC